MDMQLKSYTRDMQGLFGASLSWGSQKFSGTGVDEIQKAIDCEDHMDTDPSRPWQL